MAAPKLGEFERIARFLAPLAAPEGLGLLDDVAIIPGPPGEQYVLKTDAMRDLVAAVDAVQSNKTFFTHKVAQVVLDRHLKRMTAHVDQMHEPHLQVAQPGKKKRKHT